MLPLRIRIHIHISALLLHLHRLRMMSALVVAKSPARYLTFTIVVTIGTYACIALLPAPPPSSEAAAPSDF